MRIQCVPNSTMSQPNTYTSKRTRVFLPIVKTDRREELASVDTTQEPYNSCKSVPATHLSVKNSSRWPSSPPPPAGAPANLPGTWWRYRTTGKHQHQTTSSEYRARPTSWLAGNRATYVLDLESRSARLRANLPCSDRRTRAVPLEQTPCRYATDCSPSRPRALATSAARSSRKTTRAMHGSRRLATEVRAVVLWIRFRPTAAELEPWKYETLHSVHTLAARYSRRTHCGLVPQRSCYTQARTQVPAISSTSRVSRCERVSE